MARVSQRGPLSRMRERVRAREVSRVPKPRSVPHPNPLPLGGVGVLHPPFQAALRIQRRTAHQLEHAPRLDLATRELTAGARGELRDLELTRLRQLGDSLWRSPYYRDRLHALHLSPRDLQSFADLAQFPTLDRATLAEHWDQLATFDAERTPSDRLVVVRSSGTTGTPASVVRSELECLLMWAALRFWVERLSLALPPRPRVVLLDGLPSGLEYSVRLPFLARGALHRISLMRPGAWERLAAVTPTVLFADPAVLHALMDQPVLPTPVIVLTSAQHFAPSERARLAERISAPVINYYATTETGPIAWECLESLGSFHVLHPEIWVESIDGALAVTRLRPSPLPLVRYLPGDDGVFSDGVCACGFVGRSIHELRGRSHCELIAPNGRHLDAWQLAWLFKVDPLTSFELCQVDAQRFVLTCSARRDSAPALIPRLERALLNLGWTAPQIEARFGVAPPLRAKPTPFTRSYEPGSSSPQPCC